MSDIPFEGMPSIAIDFKEEIISEDIFSRGCKDLFITASHATNVEIVKEAVSFSKEWGSIWRADYLTEGQALEGGCINRVVCWTKRDEGMAIAFASFRGIVPL